MTPVTSHDVATRPDWAGPAQVGPGPEAIDGRPRPTVGTSPPHESARAHATGQAVYIDDIPPSRGELLVDFVGSPVAHGRIRRWIWATPARSPASWRS